MSSNVLIVKTSSLGDIIQAFAALDCLPDMEVDWVVETRFASLVAAHPRVREAIAVELGSLAGWRRGVSQLRQRMYDVVFDLQGNCKSGLLTLAARSRSKVGFGPRSVREWPNLFATNTRYEVERGANIRLQYMSIIEQHLGTTAVSSGVRFTISSADKAHLTTLLSDARLQAPLRVMVCPGSKWKNKQLTPTAWSELLQRMHEELGAAFLLMWGDDSERTLCELLARSVPKRSVIVDRLSIPVWQNLMEEVDLVLAVDSSALHLCATTNTPSFSVFGPTAPGVFKPSGERHFAMQGTCPYGQTFIKQCPRLRSCSTGACIRALTGGAVFDSFRQWWTEIISLKKR